MPVDRRYNLITLHPAKTGGTTLAYMFGWLELSSSEKQKHLVGWDRDKQVFLGTLPLCYFPKYLNDNEDIRDFTKLIIVRNPYFKMVSNYLNHHFNSNPNYLNYKNNLKEFKINDEILKKYNKFLHECKNILDDTTLDELIKPGPNLKNHLIPQIEYIKNANIDIKSINVIKLNNLSNELPIFLEEKLKYKYDKKIPVKKKSGLNDNHYLLFYKNNSTDKNIIQITQENIQLIKEMYSDDFKVFDFPCDL